MKIKKIYICNEKIVHLCIKLSKTLITYKRWKIAKH